MGWIMDMKKYKDKNNIIYHYQVASESYTKAINIIAFHIIIDASNN
jgi:hypothetical protein